MELAGAFEDEHCKVLESASVEDALAVFDTHRDIDLLVTDIRLTGALTGWDLAESLRGQDTAIPVIYVSANPPAPLRIVTGGVFIEKPALMAEVVAAAERLLA